MVNNFVKVFKPIFFLKNTKTDTIQKRMFLKRFCILVTLIESCPKDN